VAARLDVHDELSVEGTRAGTSRRDPSPRLHLAARSADRGPRPRAGVRGGAAAAKGGGGNVEGGRSFTSPYPTRVTGEVAA